MATIPIRSVRDNEQLLSKVIRDRRATPSFDGSPVSDKALSAILDAGRRAPSGFNLQPWRFVVVRDPQAKKRLREAAMGQSKVEEAGAVIVCCGDLNATRGDDLDEMFREAEVQGFSHEQNQQVKHIITNTFNARPGDAMGVTPDWDVWLNRHVMIACTTMMWMAETLGYDTAPMEGFYESKVKEALGIPDSARVVALLAIGHRKGPDKPYGGRRNLHDICFAEKWGNAR